MTDKEIIRAEIENIKAIHCQIDSNSDRLVVQVCNNLLYFIDSACSGRDTIRDLSLIGCNANGSIIDSMQENPCDGCTNRKGCITCENGELKETMQEEPVSIWHDSNEEQPNFASAVAIWNPKYKNGEILSRCTEVYSDRIWAYIDDLLKM